jgi:Coenzyme PQQ synthesis protein D (PqqD)
VDRSCRDGAESGLRPAPSVIFQRLGNEGVLIRLHTERIYELNQTATRVWEMLVAGSNRAQIEQQMVQEFDVDDRQLAQEIEVFLAMLSSEGLVE